MQNEQEIVQRAQKGDRDALARLYEINFDKIYRYIIARVYNREEAEDMTQQVFVKAFESITAFRWRGTPFTAWLFRIARNLVIDNVRKKKNINTVSLEEVVLTSNSDPQREVENKFDIERVNRATKKLTDAQREVISLRFAGGLAIAEVARVMGKSQGAVKALQHSAIVALRKALLAGENSV